MSLNYPNQYIVIINKYNTFCVFVTDKKLISAAIRKEYSVPDDWDIRVMGECDSLIEQFIGIDSLKGMIRDSNQLKLINLEDIKK